MTEETVPALDAVQPEHNEVSDNQPAQEAVQENKPEQESPQDRNWKEARRAIKELARRNEELQAQLSQVAQTKQEPHDESSPDDWVTEKKLEQKLQKRLNELESKIKAKEAETVVDRLKMRYSDFDDVVRHENVDYLKENEPEIALLIADSKYDTYRQGELAYKMLKKTDYYMNRDTMKEKKRIADNVAKPPSVNQVRKAGALDEANKFDRGLTPELRASLLKEMNEARKRG